MLADDGISANTGNHFFPYPNGQGFYNGADFMNNGFMKQLPPLDSSTRKEIVDAVFAANGQLGSSSMFGDGGQAFLQHFMAANPGGIMNMKLWWGGVVIPDEVL